MASTLPALSVPKVRTFAERIREVRIGACRLLILPTEVENVVSWRGSFLSNPDFKSGEELTQSLVVALLDKGTRKRDKFEIAEELENRGAQINFRQRGLRTGFSGRSLRGDFLDVFGIMAEQLNEPLMDAGEFDKARTRIAASVQRSLEQTGARASLALSQLMYSASHPNYTFSHEKELEQIEAIELAQLHDYHANHFGANDCIIVVVGDIDVDEVEQTVDRYFAQWKPHVAPTGFESVFEKKKPLVAKIAMPDKFNLDVKMGHQVNLRRNEQDFIPLHIGNFILGGNFSSRLMDIIRDEMGLTYGVHTQSFGC